MPEWERCGGVVSPPSWSYVSLQPAASWDGAVLIMTHHQLGEQVDEVLRGEHHRGVQRDHKARPQSQVQICRQLLLTHTYEEIRKELKYINSMYSTVCRPVTITTLLDDMWPALTKSVRWRNGSFMDLCLKLVSWSFWLILNKQVLAFRIQYSYHHIQMIITFLKLIKAR